MLQALINLFKTKKEERIEPVIEPVSSPTSSVDVKEEVKVVVDKPKKQGKPRQSKKK